MEGFGQVVSDQAIVVGKKCAAVFWHLPARNIAGEAVHHRQVELRRQRQEEIGISVELTICSTDWSILPTKAMLASAMTSTPREKRPFGHVVLHDLDCVRVLDFNAGDFVEGNRVPEANQPDLVAGIVVEEDRLGRLSAAEQSRVGRELAEEVRFSGARAAPAQ